MHHAVVSSRLLERRDHNGAIAFLICASPQQAALVLQELQGVEVGSADANALMCTKVVCFDSPQPALCSRLHWQR